MNLHPPAPISFLGAGLMGSPMAVNLAKAGFDIKVWNRTPEKTQPAIEAGARRVDTVEEAAKNSHAGIFMLQDGMKAHAGL